MTAQREETSISEKKAYRRYNVYLVADGPHKVVEEIAAMKQQRRSEGLSDKLFMDSYAPSIQRVYRFHNGYGASVIRGYMTFGKWELALIKFDDANTWRIIGETVRCTGYAAINKKLLDIMKKASQ